MFVTTITMGEVWQGFHRLHPSHPDYARIKTFANDLARRYRVLNLDARAAAMWGRMTAEAAQPLPCAIRSLPPSPGHGVSPSSRGMSGRLNGRGARC